MQNAFPYPPPRVNPVIIKDSEDRMQIKQITEPSRETPLYGEYEVVVLGGGPAGFAAALAAGRAGRATILIERYGFMGGAGTAAGLSTFCGLHAFVHGRHEQVVHGIADD